MKSYFSDLGTLRGRIFFWLGLAILPVFWIWWMRPAYFSRAQRIAGWVWTAAYVALLIVFREVLSQRFEHVGFSYPVVASHVSVGLSFWLFGRLVKMQGGELVIMIVVFGKYLVELADGFLRASMSVPPSVAILVLPVLVALAHLLVEPLRTACQNHIVPPEAS